MEEEYEQIDKIINKVLARRDVIVASYPRTLFREIATEALCEGFESGYEIGLDSGVKLGITNTFNSTKS